MQKDASHHISNFDHFFEGCVESFFMLDGVKGSPTQIESFFGGHLKELKGKAVNTLDRP